MLLLWLVIFHQKVAQSSQSEQCQCCSPKMKVLPVTLHSNLDPLSASLQPLGLCNGRSPQNWSQSSSLSGIRSCFSLMPRCGLQLESVPLQALALTQKTSDSVLLASCLLCGCDLR